MIEGVMGSQSDFGTNKRRLIALLLLVALVFLSVKSVLSGLIYLNQYYVNFTLDHWYESKELPTLNEWKELELFALSSMDGNEHNATMLNAVGRVYDFRSVRMEKKWDEIKLYGEKSVAYYRQVTQQRPAWPYGWMNIALSKARLGELDAEFKRSLLQLLKTGPWEEATLPSIIQLSLLSWRHLDTHSRQLILEYFITAEGNRGGEVFKAVKSSGRLALYCALVTRGVAATGVCQKR